MERKTGISRVSFESKVTRITPNPTRTKGPSQPQIIRIISSLSSSWWPRMQLSTHPSPGIHFTRLRAGGHVKHVVRGGACLHYSDLTWPSRRAEMGLRQESEKTLLTRCLQDLCVSVRVSLLFPALFLGSCDVGRSASLLSRGDFYFWNLSSSLDTIPWRISAEFNTTHSSFRPPAL